MSRRRSITLAVYMIAHRFSCDIRRETRRPSSSRKCGSQRFSLSSIRGVISVPWRYLCQFGVIPPSIIGGGYDRKSSGTSGTGSRFIDEMPWMDTPKFGFLRAFEVFLNGWCSGRKEVVFVIC